MWNESICRKKFYELWKCRGVSYRIYLSFWRGYDGSINQFPEQAARDNIDKQLRAAGWAIQDKDKIDWNESLGIAIRGYQTDIVRLITYYLLKENLLE